MKGPTLWTNFLLIAVGGALGANARYLLALWAAGRFGSDFPYGTLLANVSGSLALGFLLSLTTERLPLSPETRLFLTVGFLSSFTTFSSYTVESLNLWRAFGAWQSLLNVLGNNLAAFVAAILGMTLAHWLQSGG
ncbi:MAG: fluoride efflux transporter CrcB [Chloroflexota bacterium]